MLQTLANLFLPPGLLESDPTKKLATFAPQSYVDMIPEQERPQIAQMIQKQLLGGVFGGNRRQLTQDIGRGLTEYVSGRRALQDQARTSEIVSGRNDPTPVQNVLAAGAAEGSVGPTRANQQRLEQYQPPPMRETMLNRYQQLLAAGLPAQAAKFAEDIARVAPDETFTDAQTFIGQDGRPQLVRQGNRGTNRTLPYQAPPKVREVNAGDRTELINELEPGLPTLRTIGRTPDTPGDIREAYVGIGLPIGTNPDTLTPQQRTAVTGYMDRARAQKAPKFAVDLKDPTAVINAQSGLFKQFVTEQRANGDPEIANRYRALQDAVRQSASNPLADGAIIYNIAKIYDPSGAVQEGDKATVLGNRAIPEQIKFLAQKAFSGGSLTPTERQQLLRVASGIVGQRKAGADRMAAQYQQWARGLGGDGAVFVSPYAEVELPSVMIGSGGAQPASPPANAPAPTRPSFVDAVTTGREPGQPLQSLDQIFRSLQPGAR
jgi:hypothetical protein